MRGKTAKKLRKIAKRLAPPANYARNKKTGAIVVTGQKMIYNVLKKAWRAGKEEEVRGLLS